MRHPADQADTQLFERSRAIYLLRRLNRVYVRGFHRLEVLTPPTVPAAGGCIVASNHTSGLDPMLIQAVIERPIAWMMAAEFFDLPALGWLFQLGRVIPVQRNAADAASLRRAMRWVKHGGVLGIFPEGGIAGGRTIKPFRPGVGSLATRLRVPVVPVRLAGDQAGAPLAQAYLSPQCATVAFGCPEKAESGAKADDFARHLEAVVRALPVRRV